MKSPTPIATSQVKTRCRGGAQFATRNNHIEIKRTAISKKNEEMAVAKLWRTLGIDKAPIARATTAAATKALFVVGLMIIYL